MESQNEEIKIGGVHYTKRPAFEAFSRTPFPDMIEFDEARAVELLRLAGWTVEKEEN